jgi:DNA-binding response OmpR family regulator
MGHILLVEPDVVLGQTYQRALELAGHTVASAPSAQVAVDQADQRLPDVIVLELQLPAHSGVEFLYELRSYPEWQTVPVIINSHIPPQELEPLQAVLQTELGVCAMHYKPRTSLQLLLRSVAEQLELLQQGRA